MGTRCNLVSHPKMQIFALAFTVMGFVLFTSCAYAYSFLDIIPFYWRYFGEAMTGWGLFILVVCLFLRNRRIGKLLLWIGTFVLVTGLGIYFFYPKQYSKEVPEGVYYYLPAEQFYYLS